MQNRGISVAAIPQPTTEFLETVLVSSTRALDTLHKDKQGPGIVHYGRIIGTCLEECLVVKGGKLTFCKL